MKRKDLRSQIIPTRLGNTDEKFIVGNKEFDTIDLIYLDSYDEQFDGKRTDTDRCISATDHARMTNTYVYSNFTSRTGEATSPHWLRSAWNSYYVDCVGGDGDWLYEWSRIRDLGLCPSLHYNLPSNISARSALRFLKRQQTKTEDEELDIREVKDKQGRTIYHTLHIGEYSGAKVEEDLSQELENLYNGGKVKKGLEVTGRWFSENGQKKYKKDYAGKHSPEFEYQGNRYVRQISNPYEENIQYSDGTVAGKPGTVRWEKVEPISFVIRNWDEMPRSINPNGTGTAQYFDLRAEKAIIGNIPFYPDEDDKNSTMWQNSMPRGFLNGIDVRNIKQNGNPNFGASRGGDFSGECSFLNEAFNMAREPIYEYAIPESETEIPDDAFNGCIALKKLKVHPKVTSIGKRAFKRIKL